MQYGLQPFLLFSGMGIWYVLGYHSYTAIAALLFAQVFLRIGEHTVPFHKDWKQSPKEILSLLMVTLIGFIMFYGVDIFYAKFLVTHLIELKYRLNISFWPQHFPLAIQVILFYFANEFILYWLHRGFHRYKIMWRVSGHGFHHAFKNIHAINFLSSHPIEIFFLALPALLLHHLIGVPPQAMFGGGILLLINSSIIHANVKTNSHIIGWFITTSEHHHLHHSVSYSDSNSNFSCNAIIWDRIFGTYRPGKVRETGICRRNLSLREKLLLPFKEPKDIKTAPR